MTAAADVRLVLAWFDTAFPTGPAYGDPETLSWGYLVDILTTPRREGDKDGCGIVPARLKLESDGRQVRRLGANVQARSAVVLDIESNTATGEVPPSPEITADRARANALAAVVYTSHSHQPGAPRYRVVSPLSAEIDPELPAPEVLAERLGVLGCLDMSKRTPASMFYLPSCAYGQADIHRCIAVPGSPVDAARMEAEAGAMLAATQAEQDAIAAAAAEAASARRAAKIAAGFDPTDSLIEAIRARLDDLGTVLAAHGYASKGAKTGQRWRHPNSSSGGYGASIKTVSGIDRVFSHNASDPLHAGNLPAWCGKVQAIDAFDAVCILDFGSDRSRAMTELGQRYGLIQPPDPRKAAARKAVAALIFRLDKAGASLEAIERAAYAEGERLGLTPSHVYEVALWVAEQATKRRAA